MQGLFFIEVIKKGQLDEQRKWGKVIQMDVLLCDLNCKRVTELFPH